MYIIIIIYRTYKKWHTWLGVEKVPKMRKKVVDNV